MKKVRYLRETTCKHGLVRSHPTDEGRCEGGEVVELQDRCKHGRATAHDWRITTGPGDMKTTFRCRGPENREE